MCPVTPASASAVTRVSPFSAPPTLPQVHRLVALVDHHRVLSGQQIIDRAVDRRLADHHLIGRVCIDGRGRGDRRIVDVDAPANSIETKRDRPEFLARAFMDASWMSMLLMCQRRTRACEHRNHQKRKRERDVPLTPKLVVGRCA